MHIVHVANFYGPRSGSMRAALRELGLRYRAAGHEYTAIVPGKRHSTETVEFGTVVAIPALPLLRGVRSFVPTERAVRRTLEGLRPDRLEIADRLTLRGVGGWARKHGVPTVVLSPALPGGAALDGFPRVVCLTAGSADALETRLPGRASHLPLGVDLEVFTPHRYSETVRQHLLAGQSVLLTHLGRLSPEKSPGRSIETLRVLRERGVDARLVVIGDGPLRARLERAAAGLPVTFLGQLSNRRELATVLASSDIVLSPGPTESFGLVALEALASGTPVVAAASSSLGELLGTSAGELAGPTSGSFADAVGRVLARRNEVRRTEARLRASGYPWRTFVDGMLALHVAPDER